MKSNSAAALKFVLADEGGYAERPAEGGGAVSMGITFTVFEAWRQLAGKPVPTWADLKAMTVEEATQIYEAQFLSGVHFDDLPAGADYCVLDAAINGGVAGSIKLLQTVLGFAVADGHYGLVTRWAVQHRPVAKLIDDLCDARLAHYKTFSRFSQPYAAGKTKTWGDIWSARIAEVRTRAHAMATVPMAPEPPIQFVVSKPVVIIPSLSMPLANVPMPVSTELSKRMIKRGGTPEQFLAYLRDEATHRMGAWRPRMVVFHNTGEMDWPGHVKHSDGRVEILIPEQRLDNMTVDWQNRGFQHGPHIVLPPDGMVWLMNPLWEPGTHANSWNQISWGIETVGDWNKQKPTAPLVRTLSIVSAGLFSMIGHEPNEASLKFHKQNPETTHHFCPGDQLGDKQFWLQAIGSEMHAMNPGELAA